MVLRIKHLLILFILIGFTLFGYISAKDSDGDGYWDVKDETL